MLEFLLKWGWYNWLCKSTPTTSRRPVADQLRTTLPLFLHHLHFHKPFAFFRIKCILILYGNLVWFSMVVDAASNTLADQTARRSLTTICRPPKTTRKIGGCRRSARGCRCNSLTTSHRSSTNICQPPTTSGNHPENSGCQRSATGCRYSVTVAILTRTIYSVS